MVDGTGQEAGLPALGLYAFNAHVMGPEALSLYLAIVAKTHQIGPAVHAPVTRVAS